MTNTGIANVRLSPPPPELMRLINPVVRRILATRLLGSRIHRQGMVEFIGRRTGRTLRIPVCLHHADDETLIYTERPWRHNLVGAAMRAAMDDGASPFELGLKVTRGYNPTAGDLAVIARSIIRVDFED